MYSDMKEGIIRNEGILPYIKMKGYILYQESEIEKVLRKMSPRRNKLSFAGFQSYRNLKIFFVRRFSAIFLFVSEILLIFAAELV